MEVDFRKTRVRGEGCAIDSIRYIRMIHYFRTKSNGRSPKLFFVSSKSTTSTVTTTTNCYSTINAAATTCGRKKRAIIKDDVFGFSDQTSVDIEADAAHEDIVSGIDEASSSER